MLAFRTPFLIVGTQEPHSTGSGDDACTTSLGVTTFYYFTFAAPFASALTEGAPLCCVVGCPAAGIVCSLRCKDRRHAGGIVGRASFLLLCEGSEPWQETGDDDRVISCRRRRLLRTGRVASALALARFIFFFFPALSLWDPFPLFLHLVVIRWCRTALPALLLLSSAAVARTALAVVGACVRTVVVVILARTHFPARLFFATTSHHPSSGPSARPRDPGFIFVFVFFVRPCSSFRATSLCIVAGWRDSSRGVITATVVVVVLRRFASVSRTAAFICPLCGDVPIG